MDDNDVSRERDTLTRRRATVVAISLLLVLAAVAVGSLPLGRGPGTATTPLPATTRSAVATVHPVSPSAVASAPVVGFGFSAADDPSAHQLVVFGGVDSYDTTWVWDGNRWSLARPAARPPGRFGAASAYDPSLGLVLLFGGRLGPGDVVNDTWGWDGSAWRELDSGTGGPPPGEGSMMAWDTKLNEMVLVSGGTWLWQGRRWVRTTTTDLPSGAILAGLAFDPVGGTLLADTCCAGASTWQWDGAGWHAATNRVDPPAVVTLSLDPATGTLLACSDPSRAPTGRQVWSWSGHDWSPLRSQLPVTPAATVTDVVDGRLLLLGSADQPTQGAPQPLRLWSLTGSTWRQLA